jgi:hypothetical protein
VQRTKKHMKQAAQQTNQGAITSIPKSRPSPGLAPVDQVNPARKVNCCLHAEVLAEVSTAVQGLRLDFARAAHNHCVALHGRVVLWSGKRSERGRSSLM